MARQRMTIRRIDPWSILKFGFVANLVLLGVQLLAGAVLWYVIQRLELIQTVCELAATVGFEECGVDGGALFDTFLVLGLLGVVIQTGILVFLAFLANLIFDLTGGIALTLEEDTPRRSGGSRGGTGRPAGSFGAGSGRTGSSGGAGRDAETTRPPAPLGSGDTTQVSSGSGSSSGSASSGASGDASNRNDGDTLFGSS